MKRTIILFLVLAIIAVVAVSCAEKTTVTQTSGAQEEGKTTTTTASPATAQQSAAAQPDIGALEQNGLDCLAENVKVCLPVNYATGNIGDTMGFAFGFRNQFPTAKKFAIKVNFVRTQQTLGELAINVDKDYMQQWAAVNNLETYYELDTKKTLSKPILIKVQDLIGEGKPTQKGAYVFEIQVQTYENGFYEDYGGPQQITVRIK